MREQLQGRLAISPRVVLATSEVLTDDAAARIASAWATPVEGYFSTEVLVIAAAPSTMWACTSRARPRPPRARGRARAGARCAVEVEVVRAIARDAGHAAKVKLVVSEAPAP